MQALKKLGLPTDIPVRILLSKNFNDSLRVLSEEQKEMIELLRDVVTQYNRGTLKKTKITESASAVETVKPELTGLDHEESWVLFLNSDAIPLGKEMICRGSLDYTPIDSRAIISRALAYSARSIILFHNHPSGNPRPSTSDIKGTKNLKSACDTMDILLLDHIIISDGCYYSFNDEDVKELKESR